jgi:hypothetical protein
MTKKFETTPPKPTMQLRVWNNPNVDGSYGVIIQPPINGEGLRDALLQTRYSSAAPLQTYQLVEGAHVISGDTATIMEITEHSLASSSEETHDQSVRTTATYVAGIIADIVNPGPSEVAVYDLTITVASGTTPAQQDQA